MYEQHFGFDKRPFGTTATGADVFVGPQTAKTIAGLRNAVTSQDAVITVSGQVGTGKTTLIHRSIDALGMKYKTVRVGRMKIDSSEVLESLLVVLGVRDRPTGTMQRLAALRDTLKQHQDRGVRIFIVIEDAMRTGVDSLAEIEALTAADAGESDGANIIVMGDEGLAEFMRDPQLVQLQQRVRQRHTVLPLSVAELRGYLVHSFRRAGGSFEKIFDTDAAPLLHQLGGGIPRLTNNLVEATLAAAANQGLARIPASLIASVALDDFALSSEGFEFTAVEEGAAESDPDTNVETAATGPDEALSAAADNPAVVSGDNALPPVVEEADDDIPHLIQDTLPEFPALSPLEFAPDDEDATVLRDLDDDDEMDIVDEKVPDDTTLPPAEPEAVPAPQQFDETQFPADNIESFVAPPNVREEKLPPAEPEADVVQFDETLFPTDNIESFVAAPPNGQDDKRPPKSETRAQTETVPVLRDSSTLSTGQIPTLTDETGVRTRDVPEPTLDTGAETHDVAATRPVTLAKAEPPTEIVPELSVDHNDEPTMVPVPDAFPDLAEDESGLEESPQWDCDPTYAEFKPDLEALDKAMSMAADGPLDATGVSLIDTYTIDDIRGSEYIAEAKTTPPGGVAASAPPSPKLIGPFAEPTEEAAEEQVVELDQVAAKIGGSQSLEEVDDKLAETLFGTEFCFVAEQAMQLESESDLSSVELQLEAEPEPEPEPVATPRPAVIPVAREVSVDALESANDSRSGEPAAKRQKIVQSLYTDLHPSLRNAPAAKPASAAKNAAVDSMPKSIEDQIDLSMTRTLQALEAPDEATDGQSKTGFFKRFRRK